jgi:succinate dehydrogenase / fumarate reductase cytochrome b subunit
MNAVAIVSPASYNAVCEFLGANWYALIASMGLAVLFIIHIIYAVWLTLQNRKARGNNRYAINTIPKGVEWSSQNMLVLGIVVVAFLIVHLVQFWAKMQLVEVVGAKSLIPPSMGTLFIQEAFSCIATPIIYIIGFVALWFHLNHGFWSMFHTIGWDNNVWVARLKTIACWWSSIVVVIFVAQAVVFTVRANDNYYKTDSTLREQYKEVISEMVGVPAESFDYDRLPSREDLKAAEEQINEIKNNPELAAQYQVTPDRIEKQLDNLATWHCVIDFVEYLNSTKPACDKGACPAPETNVEQAN